MQVHQVGLLVLLHPHDPSHQDGPICVANTHMFFHSAAPHVRTIHMAIFVAEVAALADRMAAEDAIVPAVVLCGDLNSSYVGTQLPGCLELLRSSRINAQFPDWAVGAKFVYVSKGAAQSADAAALQVDGPVGATVHLPLCLQSADAFSLPYTNVVESYEVRGGHGMYCIVCIGDHSACLA